MDEKTKTVQKCIEELREAGIDAKMVKMYGDSRSDVIITLPDYVHENNTVSNKEST